MAMREEKADLRRKVYIIEKEKKSLELTIGSLNAQEVALKTHIQHLQDELENHELLVIYFVSINSNFIPSIMLFLKFLTLASDISRKLILRQTIQTEMKSLRKELQSY